MDDPASILNSGNAFIPTLEPSQSPIQWSRGGSFLGGKAAGPWSWPLASI